MTLSCLLNDDSNGCNGVLAVLYGIVSLFALVHSVRIQCRVRKYEWTIQKLFYVLNFLVNGVRCIAFVFHGDLQHLNSKIVQHVLLDATSLAFLSTFALLILFWAEIYNQIRDISSEVIKPRFCAINAVVYTTQIVLWLILWRNPASSSLIWSKALLACVSLLVALGFLLYGARLFIKLNQFEATKGQQKKLHEVGSITVICFTCFLIRCVITCFNAFDPRVLDHARLSFTFCLLLELLPSSLVLFILRQLPLKKRVSF